MAYDEHLAERIRKALAHLPRVRERKMFRGIAFMVNGKMCVTVGHNEMMCRIDPALHHSALQRKGCRTMRMRGREYIGWVLVSEEGMKTKKDFDHWISLSLSFNRYAKTSKKKDK
ncbi:MAG TPA: TfoX/Sxy family protein [Bacteroidota bacterium]|nr:TfoX/Sxy family protein [Bacteroidota bacterium]